MCQHHVHASRARLPDFMRICSLVAALLAATPGPAPAAPETAEAPQVRVGDHWKFEQRDKRTGIRESETARTVHAVTASGVEGAENDSLFRMTPELNPIESATTLLSGEPRFLSFPLAVGKKWSFKYSFANKTNPNKGRVQLDAEVLGYEKVATPAGSFDAFRIEAKGYWNNDASRSSGRSRSVYWYAPAARAIARAEYEDGYSNWVRELVELQLQP